METQVERYQFRLRGRGISLDCNGRVLIRDEQFTLQVFLSTAQQPDVILETAAVADREQMWSLFRKLCDYRKLDFSEFKPQGGSWGPMPSSFRGDGEADNVIGRE